MYRPRVVNATPRPPRWQALLVVGFLLVWITAGCEGGGGGKKGEADAGRAASPPVPVSVSGVVVRDMEATVGANTTLQSRDSVRVASEIAGIARDVGVERGDRVDAGRVLARVENPELRATIEEAERNVEKLDRELERLRPLYEKGYLARQQYEDLQFQRESASRNRERFRRQVATQVLRAPIGGVITARNVSNTEIVVPNQPLFEISAVDSLRAVVSLPERELRVLRLGQSAWLEVDALGGKRANGVVTRIDPIVDPQTGTVRVEIDMSDPVDLGDGLLLRPGMFASVRIVTDTRREVMAIPKRALVYEGTRAWVFALRDAPADGSGDAAGSDAGTLHRVERIAVTTGYEAGAFVEVQSGIQTSDRVVIAGHEGLDPSARVRVVNTGEAR